MTKVVIRMIDYEFVIIDSNGCERQGSPSNIINPVRSARIRTSTSFNFKFGKVEVRAKLPTGDWLWPGESFFFSSQHTL